MNNTANAFASTFLFFTTHNANTEKNKKELASQRTEDCANLTPTSNECKSLRGQFRADIGGHRFVGKEERTHNMGYMTMRGAALRRQCVRT